MIIHWTLTVVPVIDDMNKLVNKWSANHFKQPENLNLLMVYKLIFNFMQSRLYLRSAL